MKAREAKEFESKWYKYKSILTANRIISRGKITPVTIVWEVRELRGIEPRRSRAEQALIPTTQVTDK